MMTDVSFNTGASVLAQGAYDSSGQSSGGPTVVVSPGLGQPAQPTIDRALFSRVKITHGAIATMAFAAFFPLGAIAIRTVPGRLALITHLSLQFLAYAFFTASVGMGIWMSHTLEPFGADFVRRPCVPLLLFSN